MIRKIFFISIILILLTISGFILDSILASIFSSSFFNDNLFIIWFLPVIITISGGFFIFRKRKKTIELPIASLILIVVTVIITKIEYDPNHFLGGIVFFIYIPPAVITSLIFWVYFIFHNLIQKRTSSIK